MPKKAIFLDRDGTLNEDLGYTYKTEEFRLLPTVIEGLKKLVDYKLFIITNQSGISRGYYSEKDMHKYNNFLTDHLQKKGISIEKVYFCPHTKKDNCTCRKPKTGLVKKALKEHDIALKDSYVIGDHASDINLAKSCGMGSVYLLTGHGVKHLTEARKFSPDYIATEFIQAADFILFDQEDKIIKREKLAKFIDKLKKQGKKIVTINGTFDILHKGHEHILKEAKKHGDILVVGLNSDKSVKVNKGSNRPINHEMQRAKMLARFSFVDIVTIFEEKTPLALLELIKPNVHINGSEYGKECIEKEVIEKNHGKIVIIDLLGQFSTTSIIKIPKQ